MKMGEEVERLNCWAESGVECDLNSASLYLSDGLLGEQFLHNETLTTDQTELHKLVDFFLNTVHDRSIKIDLWLAPLALFFAMKPNLKFRRKAVIFSGTPDSCVISLFRLVNQIKFTKLIMPKIDRLYLERKYQRSNNNIIVFVQVVNKKWQNNAQILGFVSSLADVHPECRLLQEVSSGSVIAYLSVRSQFATKQQIYIEQGSIFFCTTIVETSLIFPGVQYVIDTDLLNMSVYDLNKEETVLNKFRAAESTIKQRIGRLKRTGPSDYCPSYDVKVDETQFPTQQLCQSELSNIELSLRKLPAEIVNNIIKFLIYVRAQETICMAFSKLVELGGK